MIHEDEDFGGQRDQYKAERDTLIDDLKVLREKNEKLDEKLENNAQVMNWKHERTLEYRKQRDKAKNRISEIGQQISELEREYEKLSKLKDIKEKALKGANYIIENQKATIKRLEQENAQLKEKNERLQKAHSDGWKQKDKVIKKLHYQYTILTDHIRLKAENNPGVSRYIELVNYIDRLERTNDEKI